jgi:hypothetical protein
MELPKTNPKHKRGCLFILISGFTCIAVMVCSGMGYWMWFRVRPQPKPISQTLFEGVTYTRQISRSPRPMVVHIVTVDLNAPGVSVLVTPGTPEEELPLEARTTSQFLAEFNLQLSVNGDAFEPWHSWSIFNYYPHTGEPVNPIGLAASKGVIYSDESDAEPVLYFARTNRARFNTPIGRIYNAISGNVMLVVQGKPVNTGDDPAIQAGSHQPRTALALDKSGRRLIIIVVDGRQPNYSQGATLAELTDIIIANGGHFGMNMDGGGSSTLVSENKSGRPVLLNAPIDHGIPGWERPVGNHLGIYARETTDH